MWSPWAPGIAAVVVLFVVSVLLAPGSPPAPVAAGLVAHHAGRDSSPERVDMLAGRSPSLAGGCRAMNPTVPSGPPTSEPDPLDMSETDSA